MCRTRVPVFNVSAPNSRVRRGTSRPAARGGPRPPAGSAESPPENATDHAAPSGHTPSAFPRRTASASSARASSPRNTAGALPPTRPESPTPSHEAADPPPNLPRRRDRTQDPSRCGTSSTSATAHPHHNHPRRLPAKLLQERQHAPGLARSSNWPHADTNSSTISSRARMSFSSLDSTYAPVPRTLQHRLRQVRHRVRLCRDGQVVDQSEQNPPTPNAPATTTCDPPRSPESPETTTNPGPAHNPPHAPPSRCRCPRRHIDDPPQRRLILPIHQEPQVAQQILRLLPA